MMWYRGIKLNLNMGKIVKKNYRRYLLGWENWKEYNDIFFRFFLLVGIS